MTKWERSRRELLARLGLGLGCLPLLRATRSYAATPAAPRRFVCVLEPEGYRMNAWLPPEGKLGTLPPSVSALEKHKQDLIFLGNLANPAYPGCDDCGHGAYGTIFAGGATLPGQTEFRLPAVASVDQVIAGQLQQRDPRPFRSFALGVRVDAARATVPLGGRRCFWRGPNLPIDPETDPMRAALRLFGVTRHPGQSKVSILDYVAGELERYKARLGAEDRSTTERHFQSIRELERDLVSAQLAPSSLCMGAMSDLPTGTEASQPFMALVSLQTRLLVLALACGVTRVATLQLADTFGSGVSFGALGAAKNDWPTIAHEKPGDEDPKLFVDRLCMTALAQLLDQMKAIPDGDATLLDQSVVLWASNTEDGGTHSARKIPWLLAGSCGGYFATGQSAASAGKPLNGVLAEICNAMGVPVASFGDPSIGAPMAGLRR
jgi:hypothetical protein